MAAQSHQHMTREDAAWPATGRDAFPVWSVLNRGAVEVCSAGILVISAAYALIVLATFPRSTVDDAFITFRYARNLALNGQLVWNVGQPPVEGYTGVAWPVVLAALIRLD